MMLSLSWLDGLITGSMEKQHLLLPAWWELTATITLMVLILSWYHKDSNTRQFRRTPWLTMAILGVAIFGIPYYLIRSRPAGKKWRALGGLTVFTGLFFSVSFIGEAMARWLL